MKFNYDFYNLWNYLLFGTYRIRQMHTISCPDYEIVLRTLSIRYAITLARLWLDAGSWIMIRE